VTSFLLFGLAVASNDDDAKVDPSRNSHNDTSKLGKVPLTSTGLHGSINSDEGSTLRSHDIPQRPDDEYSFDIIISLDVSTTPNSNDTSYFVEEDIVLVPLLPPPPRPLLIDIIFFHKNLSRATNTTGN